jgi:hypothetical protein
LRSDKYNQGFDGYLLDHDEYGARLHCCLGVYGACVSKAGIGKLEGKEYLGFKTIPREIQKSLAKKNDSGNWSFPRIASWIEKYL